MSGARAGVGQGEAQIYTMDRSQQKLDEVLQSQALERQREQKALSEQLKTIDTKNLRDPDRDEYYKKYQEWQEATAKLRTERNRNKKYPLQSEADLKFQALKDFSLRSGEAKKRDLEFGDKLLDDRFRDQFKDDAVTQFQGNFKKPITDPTYISDFNTLGRQVDEDKINKRLAEVNANLLKRAQWGNPIETKHTQGNRAGVLSFNKREVTLEEQISAYQNLYAMDRDMKKFVADKYPGVDPAEAIQDMAMQARKTGVMSEGTAPSFKENDNWKEKALFNDALAQKREARSDARKAAADGEDEPVTQRQLLVDGLRNGDHGVENQLQAIVEASEAFMPKKGADGKPMPGQLGIQKIKGTSKVVFTIPGKWQVGANGARIESLKRKLTIDMKEPASVDMINQMLNDITGVKVDNGSLRGLKGNKNKNTAPIIKGQGTPAPAKAGIPKPKDNAGKTDSVTVTLPDGRTGQIPRSALPQFKKDNPKAKISN